MPKVNKTKIAVKKEAVASAKPVAKIPAKPATKALKSRSVKSAVKVPAKPRPPIKTLDRKEKRGGFASFLITAIVVVAIVGGGIYTWQQKVGDGKVEVIKNESETLKMDFEKRLSNLKNKLSGFQLDQEELKKTQEELDKTNQLLSSAKKEFISEELGISFLYPAVFGEAKIVFDNTEEDFRFIGTFEDNDKLIFGGVSSGYVSSSTGVYSFIESLGFDKTRNKYRFLTWEKENKFEINPTKIINMGKGEALLINKDSFSLEGDKEVPVDIGLNIGVVINLDNEQYPGISFVNSDFGILSLEDFENMIKTIEFIDN